MQARNIKWLPLLMAITITGITAFQVYWLSKTYEREQRTLEKSSNITFRETVHRLQAAKLKLDGITADSAAPGRLQPVLLKPAKGGYDVLKPAHRNQHENTLQPVRAGSRNDKIANLVSVLGERVKDTTTNRTIFFDAVPDDTIHSHRIRLGRRARLMQFLYAVDSLQDTLRLPEIHAAFERRMQQQNLTVPFAIQRLEEDAAPEPQYNEVTLGFANPVTYRLELGNTTPYLLKRILAPILLSLFIVGFTTLSFALLYRNLVRQRRLAAIKNEFISNITHELKTPIATVSVAIEALRNFNARLDAQKTEEYLDISANELQRLSLLVDKVLKLSMFENKEIELKYEPLDLKELVAEVTASMRLQSEKHHAVIHTATEGDTTLEGDRLHIVSIVFNLLDNALKYSNGAPKITLQIGGNDTAVRLSISDNGIGIPPEYQDKIFDKFFRVPTGNLHNTKGYGLGLSYVAHVVRKHKGTINVETAPGGGTCFRITLPKKAA